MRVLIVDDDIPTTQAIKESINWNLFPVEDVYIANNIIKAKALINEHSPEIVLCDIEMPKGSGLDLIKWARENGIDSKFLFLTCHEEFIYAAEAIKYEAEAYITKPCEMKSIQLALAKAVEKITYQKEREIYSEFGEKWINNSYKREKGFWRDLLLSAFSTDGTSVEAEAESRGVAVDTAANYHLVLGSVRETEIEDKGWDSVTFRFALGNISSEILNDTTNAIKTVDYYMSGRYLVCTVLGGDINIDEVKEKCGNLIEMCKKYLQCEMTCYTGGCGGISTLPQTRLLLEEADAYNTQNRSAVIDVKCTDESAGSTQYTFNSAAIEKLLSESRGAEAVNKLRRELEHLESEGMLNREIMLTIQHDYMQLIYSILYNNDVQAHELFSDAPSKSLFDSSDSSVFEMMKWASYVTGKTFQYIKESRETETIVDRLKRYMNENYTRKLTRDEIASEVYLSPDYVAKLFHGETGVHLKDYLNDLRLNKAKALLSEGKMNVSEISTAVGFDNFSYFSTLFKKSVGLSPSEYKKSLE